MAQATRNQLPLQTRKGEITARDAAARTVSMIWSTGVGVQRYDWRSNRPYMEELSMDPSHIRMGRFQSGAAPLLNNHSKYDLGDVLGVIDSAQVRDGKGTLEGRFSSRAEVDPIVKDVQDGILRSVSVGYVVRKFERIPPKAEDGMWTYRAVDWEPFEASLVAIGADAGAGIRSGAPEEGERTFECEFTDAAPAAQMERVDMTEDEKRALADKEARDRAAAEAASKAELKRIADEATATATATERSRIATITTEARGLGLDDTFVRTLTESNVTVDEARAKIIAELAEKSKKSAVRSGHIDTIQDETVTKRDAFADAMLSRIDHNHKLSEAGRQYRNMSMLRMAEEALAMAGIRVLGFSPSEIADRALHSTSDFPNILANVLNRRMRSAYDESNPTYTQWARRGPNMPDFRAAQVTQLSNMPDLLQTNEDGEFKYGKMFDGAESYGVLTYGRIIGVTRQLLINDDMRALERLSSGFGNSARRLENRLVYAILTGNAVMSDTFALFSAQHANVDTGAPSAMSIVAFNKMRVAMRTQKGAQGELLNIVPDKIILPAALEQTAYQLTSSQYVPAVQANTNEFRAGGKTSLTPIIEPLLDSDSATKWYGSASNSQIDTVEYAYLQGNEGVFLDSRTGFTVDGVEFKARLDFGAKAIDYRGLWRADGA